MFSFPWYKMIHRSTDQETPEGCGLLATKVGSRKGERQRTTSRQESSQCEWPEQVCPPSPGLGLCICESGPPKLRALITTLLSTPVGPCPTQALHLSLNAGLLLPPSPQPERLCCDGI